MEMTEIVAWLSSYATSIRIIVPIVCFLIGGAIFTFIIMKVEIARHRPISIVSHADFYIKVGETQLASAEDRFLRSNNSIARAISNR